MGVAVVAMLVVGIYWVVNAATLAYCIWGWLRRSDISEEEQQRADMRSCSWPTKNGDTFAASSPLRSKAEPALVNGQVTD